ncbi:MAG: pentapeptide repeat-containing protein [Nitrospirales bacterium]|nr:pentapeptide repeat-containing protein [Nitrospirales bacterium]
MANPEHLKIFKRGVKIWNEWRKKNPKVKPNLAKGKLSQLPNLGMDSALVMNFANVDLTSSNLKEANLSCANLERADLRNADLSNARLFDVNLSGADLRKASLCHTDLPGANLDHADLRGAEIYKAWLQGASLNHAKLDGASLCHSSFLGASLVNAKLRKANCVGAEFRAANFSKADLAGSDLGETDLFRTNFYKASLINTSLEHSKIVQVDFSSANLTNCRIYGISAWSLKLDQNTKQANLIITDRDEPAITVDNLQVAQFIYLLLNNENVRYVIDTITSKVVLILGRFTPERKKILDALRAELRQRNYSPVLFDFDKPASKDVTGTVETLARMARFIIADLTEPSSIPHELATVIPFLRTTPVQPLRLVGSSGYSMFDDLNTYPWVLETYQYESSEKLIGALKRKVIGPAEAKVKELIKS